MSRYSKNLAGQKGYVFVSPAVEYTDDTTYAAFLSNAVEGEIGVFLEAGTAKTTALAAGERFFIAQKRDGEVFKTPVVGFNDIYSKRKTAYSAPARKVVTIGWNGSAGDLGLDFTGASATAVKEFALAIRETTPGNQPFPVQEAQVTVTSSTADEYTVVASLVSQLNGDFDYERVQPDAFVKAEITANGALTELLQNLSVRNGSYTITAAASITIATGTLVSIRGAIYKVAVGGTGTSFTLDRPYQGATETILVGSTVDQAATMAYTSGTTNLGIKLTGLADETHFIVTPGIGLTSAPVATATEWALGSGSGASIVELEKEGRFFAGIGSIVNAEFSQDYGLPTLFASATGTYDQFFIDLAPAIRPSAAAPIRQTQMIQKVIIAAPSSGNTPNNELTTILGL